MKNFLRVLIGTPKCCRGFSQQPSQLVPLDSIPSYEDKENFGKFINLYSKIAVLTGAGVSTESGIPDYRSNTGLFSKTTYKPIDFSTFLKNEKARTRYWARNFVGWPRFSSKIPNKTHMRLSFYESWKKVSGIITQNVDGLHYKSLSTNIIELHGNAYWVTCLNCKYLISRHDFQKVISKLNPNFVVDVSHIRPDGDVEIDEEFYESFNVPECSNCGGIMKPTVVFFGENVPKSVAKKAEDLIENSNALLVMGTTLSTLSSLRLVNQAYDSGKFICIVNIGSTRGDKMADLIINANCSQVFPCYSD